MKTILFALSVFSFAAFAKDPPAVSSPDDKPEYLKRLEHWTPANSTPPPPIVDPAAFFGLSGKVVVSDARSYLDGGTVIVEFKDEHGLSLRVVRPAALTVEEQKNNFVTISFPGRLQGKYWLRPGGTEEEALLALTRKAIVATYGSGESPAPPSESFFPYKIVSGFMRRLARDLYEPEP